MKKCIQETNKEMVDKFKKFIEPIKSVSMPKSISDEAWIVILLIGTCVEFILSCMFASHVLVINDLPGILMWIFMMLGVLVLQNMYIITLWKNCHK